MLKYGASILQNSSCVFLVVVGCCCNNDDAGGLFPPATDLVIKLKCTPSYDGRLSEHLAIRYILSTLLVEVLRSYRRRR